MIEGAGDEASNDVQRYAPGQQIERATEPIRMKKSPRSLHDGKRLIDLESGPVDRILALMMAERL